MKIQDKMMSTFNRLFECFGRKKRSATQKSKTFPGSNQYWERRYASGGNSGVGSYQKFAEFKAETINAFIETHKVQSVIEFGCGDGNQLSLAKYPRYLGFDVSRTIIEACSRRFRSDRTKNFKLMEDYEKETAEVVLSLDVIYHLVEDEVFDRYMWTLFMAAERYVIIYSSDSDDNTGFEGTHVRHRNFSKWIKANGHDWKRIHFIPNKYPYKGDYKTGSFADFHIYEKDL